MAFTIHTFCTKQLYFQLPEKTPPRFEKGPSGDFMKFRSFCNHPVGLVEAFLAIDGSTVLNSYDGSSERSADPAVGRPERAEPHAGMGTAFRLPLLRPRRLTHGACPLHPGGVVPEVRHGHGGAGGRSDRELALSHNGRLAGLRRVEERDAPFSGEPSTYDLHAARTRQERELRVQVRKHGDEAMRAEPKVAVGGSDTLSTEPFERS
jgi:hypothetical protein